MNDYEIVTSIGKGSSGAVFLARSIKIKKLVAIKRILIDDSRRSRARKSIIKEAKILGSLSHVHIVQCYEWFLDSSQDNINMVLEYCNGGTLQDRIQDCKQTASFIKEPRIFEWTAQIVSAVAYIHSRRILHRDLKSENIFLLKNEVVKLGDFGISKEIDRTLDKASTCVGTPCYLSPELCQDIPYSFKSDIWALGCLVFEMAALIPAFDAHNLVSLFFKIVHCKYAAFPERCSKELRSLIDKILVRDPENRPSANELAQLPCLKRYQSTIDKRVQEIAEIQDINRNESLFNTQDLKDCDDLDDLLNALDLSLDERQLSAEQSRRTIISAENTPRSNTVHGQYSEITPRSFTVNGEYSSDRITDFNPTEDIESLIEPDSPRPQTCPHSASASERIKRTQNDQNDTVGTWSGYGDRNNRRPSGGNLRSLSPHSMNSSTETLSDFSSGDENITPTAVNKHQNNKLGSDSSDSGSESDDGESESRLSNITVIPSTEIAPEESNTISEMKCLPSTGEEDIPEVIETVEESDDGSKDTARQAFTNMLNRPPKPLTGMNLPGTAWLQSKRAQVLRQRQAYTPSIVLTAVQRNDAKRNGMLGHNVSQSVDLSMKHTSPIDKKYSPIDKYSINSVGRRKNSRSSSTSGDNELRRSETAGSGRSDDSPIPPDDVNYIDRELPGSAWLLGKKIQRQQQLDASSNGAVKPPLSTNDALPEPSPRIKQLDEGSCLTEYLDDFDDDDYEDDDFEDDPDLNRSYDSTTLQLSGLV